LKDTVEKESWIVGQNVSIELAFDREIWRGLLVAAQVLQELLS